MTTTRWRSTNYNRVKNSRLWKFILWICSNWDVGFGFLVLRIPRILELFTWVCENCLNCENLIPTNDLFNFKLIDQYRIGNQVNILLNKNQFPDAKTWFLNFNPLPVGFLDHMVFFHATRYKWPQNVTDHWGVTSMLIEIVGDKMVQREVLNVESLDRFGHQNHLFYRISPYQHL